MIDRTAPGFWAELLEVLLMATARHPVHGVRRAVFTVLIGLPLGVVLVLTEPAASSSAVRLARRRFVINRVLDFVVNIGRIVPFMILMVALIPFTRLVVGTLIGTTATIVPLAAVAIPFFARIVEIAIKEVDHGLIEAAESLGASRGNRPQGAAPAGAALDGSRPATTVTSIINFSAMVGVVAGGGSAQWRSLRLPALQLIHMVTVIIIIFVIVMILQGIAARLARRCSPGQCPRRQPRQVAAAPRLRGQPRRPRHHAPPVPTKSTMQSHIRSSALLVPLLPPSPSPSPPARLRIDRRPDAAADGESLGTINVGALAVPAGELLTWVDENLAADAGLDIEWTEFTDFNTPNPALADGSIDANLFQNSTFLKTYNEASGPTWSRRRGLPAGRRVLQRQPRSTTSRTGDVAIPDDPTNEGRALEMLAAEG